MGSDWDVLGKTAPLVGNPEESSMYRKSLVAGILALTTCLALAQPARAGDSASDLAKFVPAPAPAGAYSQE
jgi:hypothetical protein